MTTHSHLPPVPPKNTSSKGPGDDTRARDTKVGSKEAVPSNVHKEGQQGNSRVNTTHQGYQQDR